jgi:HTH-type transcriptional regulator/antitoxin HipB|tara:strand:+ start:315 stop:635 length:321 start_codon:yes stop_codon:yes gene_type:complete
MSPYDDIRKDEPMLIRTARDLGAVIRDHRRRLGLGQQALADRIGVSRQWVVEVEKGKPRAEVGLILRALDALGVTLVLGGGISGADDQDGAATDIDAIVDGARGAR